MKWAPLVVNTVVAVWIHLLNSRSLLKLVTLYDIINTLFTTPRYKVLEHLLHFCQIKFSCTRKSENVMVIEMELFEVCNSSCGDPLFEVSGDLVLLWACIAHEATIYSFCGFSGPKWHFC